MELQLRTIERALARQRIDGHVHRLAGGAIQLGLSDVPDLVGAESLLWTERQLHGMQLHAKVRIDRIEQPHEPRRLLFDLVLAAEDVGVVLGEGAQPHDAMQGAGRLEPVARAELGHPQRQVAVALLSVIEDLHMARTVHRLDGQSLALLCLAGEHGLAELLPVAGTFPHRAVHQLRRLDLDIAVGLQPAAHVGLDRPVERPALGVPEDHPFGLFLQVEEVHGPADLAMVALLGFLQAMQVRRQVGFGRPGRAVDALQHRIAVIAPPVGAGQLGQLERLAGDLGRGQVRASAEVLPGALAIDRDVLAGRDAADDLGLVDLADQLKVGDGRLAVPDLAHDRLVAVDDLLHARLDLGEVIQAERLLAGEVVIEAVLDSWADGHLRAGEQLLHRLSQDMAYVVADGFQRLGRIARQDLERAAVLQGAVDIQQLAVQFHQGGALGQ